MPLVDFVWERDFRQVAGEGLCKCGTAKDSVTGRLIDVVVPVSTLDALDALDALDEREAKAN